MNAEKLTTLINLKDKIEKLTRMLKGGNGDFYIGNPEQNTHDYYRVDGELGMEIRKLLVDKLHKLETEFEKY